MAHYRAGEKPCEACRAAHDEREKTDLRSQARNRAKSRARGALARLHHSEYLALLDEVRGEGDPLTWNQVQGRAKNRLVQLYSEDFATLLRVEKERAYGEIQ